MPTVITPVVTDAGFDAAINLSSSGLQLDITHVAISGVDKFTPNALSTIPHRTEKTTIAGSIKTGTGAFLVSVYLPSFSGAAYNVTAIGFYAGDPDAGGVLVAVYSHPTATIFQRNSLDWVGQFALKLTRVPNDSVGVVVDPQASIAVGLLQQHLINANPHAQYLMKLGLADALPTTDIGVIWHDYYNSLMSWQVFNQNGANYIGYASIYVGRLEPDSQPTARPGKLKTGSSNVNKVARSSLWNWALHNGLVVPLGSWDQGMNAYADNGNGTFRTPDLRAENMRIFDDGRGVDLSRAFTSWQNGQMPEHVHLAGSYHFGSGGLYASSAGSAGGSDVIYNYTEPTGGTSNGSENRSRNFVQLGSIQI